MRTRSPAHSLSAFASCLLSNSSNRRKYKLICLSHPVPGPEQTDEHKWMSKRNHKWIHHTEIDEGIFLFLCKVFAE